MKKYLIFTVLLACSVLISCSSKKEKKSNFNKKTKYNIAIPNKGISAKANFELPDGEFGENDDLNNLKGRFELPIDSKDMNLKNVRISAGITAKPISIKDDNLKSIKLSKEDEQRSTSANRPRFKGKINEMDINANIEGKDINLRGRKYKNSKGNIEKSQEGDNLILDNDSEFHSIYRQKIKMN